MNDGLIIDMFAGGGGASMGIRQALGREVDIAVNHDLKALMMHAINHPQAKHVQEDVFTVKLAEYTQGRHVSLMWASPDCAHFSRARGGKPKSQHVRMLPWAVYEQARAVMPDVIVMENVCEIQTWEDYHAFIQHMQGLGYTFESRELCAADFGARTSRTRWYAVLRRDGCATEWPKQTHVDRSHYEQMLALDIIDKSTYAYWNSVCECLDLSDLGQSISGRRKPLSDKTMERIQRGNHVYAPNYNHTQSWIMSYYGTGVGQSIYEPLRTITCKDRFALVTRTWTGHTYLRMLQPEELKLAQGFPKSYIIDRYSDGTRVPKAEQVRRIGNSVVPLMAQLIVTANARAT